MIGCDRDYFEKNHKIRKVRKVMLLKIRIILHHQSSFIYKCTISVDMSTSSENRSWTTCYTIKYSPILFFIFLRLKINIQVIQRISSDTASKWDFLYIEGVNPSNNFCNFVEKIYKKYNIYQVFNWLSGEKQLEFSDLCT